MRSVLNRLMDGDAELFCSVTHKFHEFLVIEKDQSFSLRIGRAKRLSLRTMRDSQLSVENIVSRYTKVREICLK
jgi:hypothetical protein